MIARGDVSSKKLAWLLTAIAAGALCALLPTPQGLSRIAQLVLAITVFTAVLWAGQAAQQRRRVGPHDGADGDRWDQARARPQRFRDASVLDSALRAVLRLRDEKTRLADRISYYILSLFPGTYAGILSAFFVIGLVLASACHP